MVRSNRHYYRSSFGDWYSIWIYESRAKKKKFEAAFAGTLKETAWKNSCRLLRALYNKSLDRSAGSVLRNLIDGIEGWM